MKQLIGIAWRNLVRQRRRSALIGVAIVVGIVAAFSLTAFFNGVIDALVRMTVEASIGAVQVHKKGHLDAEEPLKLDMPESPELVARMKAVPGVKAVAPRLMFEGMINNGTRASMVIGTGIDPQNEYAVCPGRKDVLGSKQPLETRAGDRILIGDELANAMALEVGSSPVIMAPTPKGQSNALDASIQGLVEVKLIILAKLIAVVPLDFAQSLLGMKGRVTEYAIAVDDVLRAGDVAAALRKELGDDYEVHTWGEREPGAGAAIGRFNFITAIVIFVLFLLVGSILVNAMLMSVQERVREIGTMLALGVRRRQILQIVIIEAGLLSLVAAFVGMLIGLAVVAWMHQRGIVFAPRGGKAFNVYPFAGWSLMLKTILGAVVGASIATLYPALKASRLSPVEALRSV